MVGLQVASDLLMSGRFFLELRRLILGWLRAVPSDEVLDTALGWAIDVAANTAPVSVAVTKNMMWENLLPEIKDTFRKGLRLIPWLGSQPDAAEGVMHFMEKRPPSWSGSVLTDMPDLDM